MQPDSSLPLSGSLTFSVCLNNDWDRCRGKQGEEGGSTCCPENAQGRNAQPSVPAWPWPWPRALQALCQRLTCLVEVGFYVSGVDKKMGGKR